MCFFICLEKSAVMMGNLFYLLSRKSVAALDLFKSVFKLIDSINCSL